MARPIVYIAEARLNGNIMLIHRCDVDSLGKGKAKKKDEGYADEWKKTIYTTWKGPQGEDLKTPILCMPAMNMEAMLRDAAKTMKLGGERASMSKTVAIGVLVKPFEVPLMHNPEYEFKEGKRVTKSDKDDTVITAHDVGTRKDWLLKVPVVVQRQRVARTRAQIHDWVLTFTMEVTDPRIEPEALKQILETGGYEIGVGDWRPGSPKPGRFGIYDLERFQIIEDFR